MVEDRHAPLIYIVESDEGLPEITKETTRFKAELLLRNSIAKDCPIHTFPEIEA